MTARGGWVSAPAWSRSPQPRTCWALSRPSTRSHDGHTRLALSYTWTGCITPAHAVVAISALRSAFFPGSPYKFCGPHCAALAADPALLETLNPDKLRPATN